MAKVEPIEGHATYVYAVVKGARPPALAGAPSGLAGGAPPRAIRAGRSLWIVAADVPLDRYNEAALERGLRDLDWVSACALAHEGVVEHVARRAPAVPMKLLTIFRSDERAIENVTHARSTLDRAFRRIAGAAEWGVRIFRAPARAGARAPQADAEAAPSGAAFLRRKKAARDAARAEAADAAAAAEAAHTSLRRLARDARVKPPVDGEAGARLLLDAAYLVADARRTRFRAEAARQARRCAASACTLTLTGPWPAYHFIE
jgi:hypothetical protein